MGYNNWHPEREDRLSRSERMRACQPKKSPVKREGGDATRLDSPGATLRAGEGRVRTLPSTTAQKESLFKCPLCSKIVTKSRTAAHLMSMGSQIVHHEREQAMRKQLEEEEARAALETEASESDTVVGEYNGRKNCFKMWPGDSQSFLETIYEHDRKNVSWSTPTLAKQLSKSTLAKNLSETPLSSSRSQSNDKEHSKGASLISQMLSIGNKNKSNSPPSILGWRLESVFRV